MRSKPLLILLAALLPIQIADSQDRGNGRPARRGGSGFERLVPMAADADRDGSVTAAEWSSFLETLPLDDNGGLARQSLKASIVLPYLDQDRNGALTLGDVEEILMGFDADESGNIDPDELTRRRGAAGTGSAADDGSNGRGGSSGRTFGMARLIRRIVAESADGDRDGEVTGAEWTDFEASIGDVGDAVVPLATVASWVTESESRVPEDRSSFTSGVFLLTLDSMIDQDKNGVCSAEDLGLIHAAMDLDGDGELAMSEISPARRGGSRGRDRTSRRSQGSTTAAGEEPAAPPIDPDSRPLMPWQRNLDDAVALSKETGKPLLICVNMDGEMAGETLARVQYRDPRFVELARGFIPVLASPDRHALIDHDDRGVRVVDPYFGRVTSAEHIDIEPTLFRNYFRKKRVSPRHVGVSPEGEILFDLSLLYDLSRIDESLAEFGVAGELPDPDALSETELLVQRDAACRDRLEAIYLEGDEATRARLAALALSSVRAAQHPEILRMALRDPAVAVREQALWSIGRHPGQAPLELYPEALRLCTERGPLRQALIAGLGELARTSDQEDIQQKALRMHRMIARVDDRSELLDVERWQLALEFAPSHGEPTPKVAADDSGETGEMDRILAQIARIEKALEASPDDRELNLLLAEANIRYALSYTRMGLDATFLLQAAVTAAETANRSAGADVTARGADVTARGADVTAGGDGRAHGYLAWAHYLMGDAEATESHLRPALAGLAGHEGSSLSARLLAILAELRNSELDQALTNGREFPGSLVADVRAAHEVLLAHPLSTEWDVQNGLRFYETMGARQPQREHLMAGLERFPVSGMLHEWLRMIVLRDEGAQALEPTYASLPAVVGREADREWFLGLSSLVAAQRYIQLDQPDRALPAFDQAITRFDASRRRNPEFEDSSSHYICLAWSRAARLHSDAGRLDEAVKALENGFHASKTSVTTKDGLGERPLDHARHVRGTLLDAGRTQQASQVLELMGQLTGEADEDKPES